MYPHLGKSVCFADIVDLAPEPVWRLVRHTLALGTIFILEELAEAGDHKGDDTIGLFGFGCYLLHILVLFVLRYDGMNTEGVGLKIYVVPFEAQQLSAAQTVEGEKRFLLEGLAIDGFAEYDDLLRREPLMLGNGELWKRYFWSGDAVFL